MNFLVRMQRLARHVKYRHDKKEEGGEDLVSLLESTNENIQLKHLRRIPLLAIVRYLFLSSFVLYLLLICTPVRHLQTFVPREMSTKKNFLLVVAHPDDECLFFSPTILALIARGQTGHVLVLSTGNSLGLGPLREKELRGSCARLGVEASRCLALNLTELQDNPRLWWPRHNISSLVQQYIERFDIELLITFDQGGISGHLNHRSIAVGVQDYIARVARTPLVYELATAASLFEFSSLLDLCRTTLKFLPRLLRSLFSTLLPFLLSPPDAHRALFVSSPLGYFRALQAFHAHHSQVLWYRHLYTTFSRHMFINDLIQISHH